MSRTESECPSEAVELHELDDAALMALVAERDPDALDAIYHRHAPVVFALCSRVLRNAAEAEEVLQEVFWEVWARAERYEARRAAPRAYLVNLARSRSLDRLRLHRRRDALIERAGGLAHLDPIREIGRESAASLDAAMLGEERRRVRDALASLPPAQRRAVTMSFFDGLSHSEIASALDTPLGTIKTQIRRGLLRLRDALVSLEEPAS